MKKFNKIFTILVFVFLYVPMIVLIVASFNAGKDLAVFNGFTLRNYREFFSDSRLLTLLGNSLVIAVLSSLCATVLGTVAAVGIHNMRGRLRSAIMSVTNIPLTNPEIVTGVSLALLFAFVGTLLKIKSILGFWTLLIAHITFNMPYVILSVMPKLKQMDPNIREAALDLGCTPAQAFFKVVLHEIMPGIISGAIMAFTMSLDDFIISYFVSGGSYTTLPVEIYSYTKKQIDPKVYALFTIMFAAILILMVTMNLLQMRDAKSRRTAVKRRAES
ncbi:MAG: ABC transporter permease [Faecousia sp.]